jgi:hypothetical protein
VAEENRRGRFARGDGLDLLEAFAAVEQHDERHVHICDCDGLERAGLGQAGRECVVEKPLDTTADGEIKNLQSLEDFAQHYFGESFGELSEEQQMEVGRLYRATPMGEWVKPGSGRFPTIEDERLRHEDDRLRAEVQRWMVWILWISAVGWSIAATVHETIRAGTIEAWGWTMAMVVVTLRQAIVLWSEEDPRVTSAEMELVEREA